MSPLQIGNRGGSYQSFLLNLLSHHKAILVGQAITTFLEGLLKATNHVAVLIDYFTVLTRGIVGAVSYTPMEWPF